MKSARWLVGLMFAAWFAAPLAADANEANLNALTKKEWTRDKAAHLLRRAGFGGSAAEIDKLTALGLDAAVDFLVDYEKTPYDLAPPPIDEILYDPPDRMLLRELSEEERQAYQQKRQEAERVATEEIRLWWLERMLESPRPFEEKMTFFWHGHFTSGAREVRNAVFLREQNDFLRKNALGNFRELALGISRDRAMLAYLNNNQNHKGQPNENYARELMELFTLGVGHYGEDDIKAAARAFTGWTFDRDGFVFRRRDHDYDMKTFLGRTGKWDGEDIVNIIVEQPACSRFLAKNLLEFFCRADPPKELVERFALVIRQNKFELKPALKTLFKSKAFYHPEAVGGLVKSPVELLIGTARQLDISVANLAALERAAGEMGQALFQPPNVKGWDGGAKWINTASLYNRYNFVGGMIYGGGKPGPLQRRFARRAAQKEEAAKQAAAESKEPGGKKENAMKMMDMMFAPKDKSAKSRLVSGEQPAYDALEEVRQNKLETAEQIVDFYAAHLLARPLPSAKRDQLVRYLQGDGPAFDVKSPAAAQRLRTTVHLLCSTPEYQMN